MFFAVHLVLASFCGVHFFPITKGNNKNKNRHYNGSRVCENLRTKAFDVRAVLSRTIALTDASFATLLTVKWNVKFGTTAIS